MKLQVTLKSNNVTATHNKAVLPMRIAVDDEVKPTVISFMINNRNVGSLSNADGITTGDFEPEFDFSGLEPGGLQLVAEAYNPELHQTPLFVSGVISLQVDNLKSSIKDTMEPRARLVNLSPAFTSLLLPIIHFDIEDYLVKKTAENISNELRKTKYSFNSREIDSAFSLKTFINNEEVTATTILDYRHVIIKTVTPLRERANEIRVELSYAGYPDKILSVQHELYLDTTPPVIEINTQKLYTTSLKPELDIIIKDSSSGVDLNTVVLKINTVEVPFHLHNKEIGNFHEIKATLSPLNNLWEGKHSIEITVKDTVGNTSQALKTALYIDTIPPILNKTEPSENDVVNSNSPSFRFFFIDKQLPAIARRPIQESLGIGGKNLKHYLDAGVTKVYQLLDLNPNNNPVLGIQRVSLIRKIAQARLITDIDLDANIYCRLLHCSIYEIAKLSYLEIAEIGSISAEQALELHHKLSALHGALDLGVTKKITVGQCTSVEGSGVKKIALRIDSEDVSSQVAITPDRAEYRYNGFLPEGPHTIYIRYEDAAGNWGEKSIMFFADGSGPEIAELTPGKGAYINDTSISLTGKFSDQLSGVDPTSVRILLNSRDICSECKISETGFSAKIKGLAEQEHTLEICVSDKCGNLTSLVSNFFVDTTPPRGYLDTLRDLTATTGGSVHINGRVTSKDAPAESFSVTINDNSAIVQDDFSFSAEIPLKSGMNEIRATISDRAGNYITTNTVSVFNVTENSTAVFGQLHNEDGQPVKGGRVYVKQTESWTLSDQTGKFCIYSMPLKSGISMINVKAAENDSTHYQPLSFRKEIKYGVAYDVGKLVLLNSIVESSGVPLEEGRYTEITDTNGEFTVTLPPKEQVSFPFDTGGKVAIRLLEPGIIPYKPQGFSTTNYVLSLEPSGLKILDEDGASLEFKNKNNLSPGSIVPLYSFDHLTGRYKIAAIAKVSADSEYIRTIQGHGIRSFSEKFVAAYEPEIEVLKEDRHVQGFNSLNKGLSLEVGFPSFRYLDNEIAPVLVYNSMTANPCINVTGIFKGLRQVKSFRKVESRLSTQTVKGTKAIIDLYAQGIHFLDGDQLMSPSATITTYMPLEDDAISTLSEDEQLREFNGFYGIRVEVVTLYEIEWEILPETESVLWPKAIHANYFMGDQESDNIVVYGKPISIDAEGTTIQSYQLPVNLAVKATLLPPVDLPTGIYTFMAKYRVIYEGYEIVRYASIAQSLNIEPGFLSQLTEARNSATDPAKRIELDNVLNYFNRVSESISKGLALPSEMQVKPIDASELQYRGDAGSVIINNQVKSNFGRGWQLKNIARVFTAGHNKALLVEGNTVLPFAIENTFSVQLYSETNRFCILPDSGTMAFTDGEKITLFDMNSLSEISTIAQTLPLTYDRTIESNEFQTYELREVSRTPIWLPIFALIPYPCGFSFSSGIKWCHIVIEIYKILLFEFINRSWLLISDWVNEKDFPKDESHLNAQLEPQVSEIISDNKGNIYIADTGTHRIYRLSKENNYQDWIVICGRIQEIKQVEPTVTRDVYQGNTMFRHRYNKTTIRYIANTAFTPDGIPASEASIYAPSGLAFDKDGNLIFSEMGNNRIRRINKDGKLETVCGNGSADFKPVVNAAAEAAICSPGNLCVDNAGNILCLLSYTSQGDDTSQVLIKIDPNGNLTHMAGNPQGTTTTGTNGQFYKMKKAHQVVSDRDNNYYVYLNAGALSKIVRIDERGLVHDFAGGTSDAGMDGSLSPLEGTINEEGSIQFTKEGNLLLLDGGMLRQVTLSLLELGSTMMRGPIGYFDSVLTRAADGSWIRKFKDGAEALFDSDGFQQKYIYPNGNQALYSYTAPGLIERIQYDKGQFIAFTYDEQSNIKEVSDHTGRTTVLAVQEGNLREISLPDERKLKFNYDEMGRLISKEEQ